MQAVSDAEDVPPPAGLKRYFGPGPRLAESGTLFGFSTMVFFMFQQTWPRPTLALYAETVAFQEIVNRLNIVLAVLSCLSMLLGLFTYVCIGDDSTNIVQRMAPPVHREVSIAAVLRHLYARLRKPSLNRKTIDNGSPRWVSVCEQNPE